MYKFISKLTMCLALASTFVMSAVEFGNMSVREAVKHCEEKATEYCQTHTCKLFCKGDSKCEEECKGYDNRCRIIPLGGTMDEQGNKRQLDQGDMIKGNDALYETTRKQVVACIAQARGNPAAPTTHWKTMVTNEYRDSVPNWEPKMEDGESETVESGTRDMGNEIDRLMKERREARESGKKSHDRGMGKGSIKDRIKAWGG